VRVEFGAGDVGGGRAGQEADRGGDISAQTIFPPGIGRLPHVRLSADTMSMPRPPTRCASGWQSRGMSVLLSDTSIMTRSGRPISASSPPPTVC
jgi:hypothetical protein